jgi:hypothetical protein
MPREIITDGTVGIQCIRRANWLTPLSTINRSMFPQVSTQATGTQALPLIAATAGYSEEMLEDGTHLAAFFTPQPPRLCARLNSRKN